MITPRQAIRMAEVDPKITTKEREKILAISLIQLLIENPSRVSRLVELKILWSFSQMIAEYKIPDLCMQRALDMHKNPSRYVNYK